MGFAKEPLTEEEEAKVLTAATLHSDFAHKLCLLLRHTGMHISVFYKPEKNLRLRQDGGNVALMWDRPKKDGVKAFTSTAIHDELKPWIEEFLKQPRDARKSYYDHLFEEISAIAGIKVSPMSFRHTFAVWLLDSGKTIEAVMQALNCTREVAERYGKYSKVQMKKFWEGLPGY